MNYYLHPPLFRVEPHTSFDVAWEVFCCEMLNLANSTDMIHRRTPPDLGADLVWEDEKTVFQCKAVLPSSSINLTKVKQSINRAKENQGILEWEKYVLCTNVTLSGDQEQKLKEYLPGIIIRSEQYWIELCYKFSQNISHHFHFLSEAVPQSRIWNVPYHHNPFFTSREEIIAEFYQTFQTGLSAGTYQTQALYGLGGIGKTQIVVEYAHRYQDSYQSVFWVRATSKETLVADFINIADMLQISHLINYDQQQMISLVKQWLIQHVNWLLVFDGADDLTIIYDFLPTGGKGHILITTRDSAVQSIAKSVEVEKLTVEDGVLFLLKRARLLDQVLSLSEVSLEDRTIAESLASMMDGLPLALEQAGAYIVETRCGLSRYYDLYQEKHLELLERRSRLPSDYPETVMTTWSLSFHEIERTNLASAELLRLCAFLQPDFIPEEIITNGLRDLGTFLEGMAIEGAGWETFTDDDLLRFCSFFQERVTNQENIAERVCKLGLELQIIADNPLRIDEMLSDLLRFSLIRRDSNTKALSIHHLVQLVLLNGIDKDVRCLWVHIIILVVKSHFPYRAEPETWLQCQRYFSQAMACISHIAEYFNEIIGYGTIASASASLLNIIGHYLHGQGDYKMIRFLYESALNIYLMVLEPDNINIIIMRHQLARLSLDEGKYDEAEYLFHYVIDMYHQMPLEGKLLEEALMTFHELARLSIEQEKYEKAGELLRYTLKMREELLGLEHRDTAMTLHEMAALHCAQKRYKEAGILFERVLQIEENVLGAEHFDTAITLTNLAEICYFQRKIKEAQLYFERALNIFEKELGLEHTRLTVPLIGLAQIYEDQGMYEKAVFFWERGISIAKKTQELDVNGELVLLRKLSLLCFNQNLFEKAELFSLQILSLEEAVPDKDFFMHALTLQNLAHLYLQEGKYGLAEHYNHHVLNISNEVSDQENLDMSTLLYGIAASYVDKDQYKLAIPYLERSISIRIKILGFEHPETQSLLQQYSTVLHRAEQKKAVSLRPSKKKRSRRTSKR